MADAESHKSFRPLTTLTYRYLISGGTCYKYRYSKQYLADMHSSSRRSEHLKGSVDFTVGIIQL